MSSVGSGEGAGEPRAQLPSFQQICKKQVVGGLVKNGNREIARANEFEIAVALQLAKDSEFAGGKRYGDSIQAVYERMANTIGSIPKGFTTGASGRINDYISEIYSKGWKEVPIPDRWLAPPNGGKGFEGEGDDSVMIILDRASNAICGLDVIGCTAERKDAVRRLINVSQQKLIEMDKADDAAAKRQRLSEPRDMGSPHRGPSGPLLPETMALGYNETLVEREEAGVELRLSLPEVALFPPTPTLPEVAPAPARADAAGGSDLGAILDCVTGGTGVGNSGAGETGKSDAEVFADSVLNSPPPPTAFRSLGCHESFHPPLLDVGTASSSHRSLGYSYSCTASVSEDAVPAFRSLSLACG